MSIGFATPWLLLGLLAVPLLAFAPRWTRRRGAPAALRFSDTSMTAAPASWRTRLAPGLRVLRLLALALVVVAGWLFWRGLTQAGGRRIQVAGANWSLEADCEADYDDLQEFANALLLMQSSAEKSRW